MDISSRFTDFAGRKRPSCWLNRCRRAGSSSQPRRRLNGERGVEVFSKGTKKGNFTMILGGKPGDLLVIRMMIMMLVIKPW